MEAWFRAYAIQIRVSIAVIIGLCVAVYLGEITADYPLQVPFLLVSSCLFIFFWFLSEDYYWQICIASILLGGNFNFLPADLNAFEILAFIGVLKFVVQHVVLKKQGVLTGPRFDFFLMVGFMTIILLHAIKNRFGMRVLGSPVWGGRPYVSVLLCFTIYLIIQTVKLDLKKWRWLPLIVLVPAIFDLIIGLTTYFFPSTIRFIYPFYSAVSLSGIEGVDPTERLGALAEFGLPLLLITLAYSSLVKLWRPQFWMSALLIVLGIALSIQGGYRSSVLNCALILTAASLRDFKLWAWLPVIFFIVLLLSVAVLHSNGIIALPMQAQRALVFLPGKWDTEMVENAEGSNKFRFDIWERWYQRKFVNRPWLGGGFGFDMHLLNRGAGFYALDYETELDNFILTQNLHNGFISSLDGIGIIGCLFFIVWCMSVLFKIVFHLYKSDPDILNPGLRWTALYLFMWTCSFWIGSLRLVSFLPTQLIMAAVFLRLLEMSQEDAEPKGIEVK